MNTPLHEAASANSMGCVSYLLSAGARQDVCNASGETPFDCSTLHEVKKYVYVCVFEDIHRLSFHTYICMYVDDLCTYVANRATISLVSLRVV